MGDFPSSLEGNIWSHQDSVACNKVTLSLFTAIDLYWSVLVSRDHVRMLWPIHSHHFNGAVTICPVIESTDTSEGSSCISYLWNMRNKSRSRLGNELLSWRLGKVHCSGVRLKNTYFYMDLSEAGGGGNMETIVENQQIKSSGRNFWPSSSLPWSSAELQTSPGIPGSSPIHDLPVKSTVSITCVPENLGDREWNGRLIFNEH